jgi:hypothetical protein
VTASWKRWGRALPSDSGTVRGLLRRRLWVPHDHARSRSYRWGRTALGITDREGRPASRSRYGTDGTRPEGALRCPAEGNRGEDVKESYYTSVDPTHGYMKALYNCPSDGYHAAAGGEPTSWKAGPGFELVDTGYSTVSATSTSLPGKPGLAR